MTDFEELQPIVLSAALKTIARRVIDFAADDDIVQDGLHLLTQGMDMPGWKIAEAFHMAVISQLLQQMETTAFVMKKVWEEEEELPADKVNELFTALRNRNNSALDFVIGEWRKQAYQDGNWAAHAAHNAWEEAKGEDGTFEQQGAAL